MQECGKLQTRDVFDTFCFTVCWQGLRENCSTEAKQARAPQSDHEGDEEMADAEDAASGEPDPASVKIALEATAAACEQVGLAAKQDALLCAVDQCGTILRMALAEDVKGSKQKDPAAVLMSALLP